MRQEEIVKPQHREVPPAKTGGPEHTFSQTMIEICDHLAAQFPSGTAAIVFYHSNPLVSRTAVVSGASHPEPVIYRERKGPHALGPEKPWQEFYPLIELLEGELYNRVLNMRLGRYFSVLPTGEGGGADILKYPIRLRGTAVGEVVLARKAPGQGEFPDEGLLIQAGSKLKGALLNTARLMMMERTKQVLAFLDKKVGHHLREKPACVDRSLLPSALLTFLDLRRLICFSPLDPETVLHFRARVMKGAEGPEGGEVKIEQELLTGPWSNYFLLDRPDSFNGYTGVTIEPGHGAGGKIIVDYRPMEHLFKEEVRCVLMAVGQRMLESLQALYFTSVNKAEAIPHHYRAGKIENLLVS